MEARIQEKGTVRLLRVDIDTWGSPVAKQYGINRLPTVWFYEGTRKVSTDTRQSFNLLEQ